MSITFEQIVSVLTLLGVGGILAALVKLALERRNSVELQKQEYKDKRYKCTILLMYSLLNFERDKDKLRDHGRNFKSGDDLLNELKAEWANAMILFASEEALRETQAFILNPTKETFFRAAIAMRKDLWGGRIDLIPEDIRFDICDTPHNKRLVPTSLRDVAQA